MAALDGVSLARSLAWGGALACALVASGAFVTACGSGGFNDSGSGGPFGWVGSGSGGRHDGGVSHRDGAVEGDSGGANEPDAGSTNEGTPDAGDGGGGGPDAGQDSGTGVGISFSVPSGLFSKLDWVIAGPSGRYSGTVDIGAAESIEFVAGGVQAGPGYTLSVTGVEASGATCSGTSAPFAVEAGQSAHVSLGLTCTAPPDAGADAED